MKSKIILFLLVLALGFGYAWGKENKPIKKAASEWTQWNEWNAKQVANRKRKQQAALENRKNMMAARPPRPAKAAQSHSPDGGRGAGVNEQAIRKMNALRDLRRTTAMKAKAKASASVAKRKRKLAVERHNKRKNNPVSVQKKQVKKNSKPGRGPGLAKANGKPLRATNNGVRKASNALPGKKTKNNNAGKKSLKNNIKRPGSIKGQKKAKKTKKSSNKSRGKIVMAKANANANPSKEHKMQRALLMAGLRMMDKTAKSTKAVVNGKKADNKQLAKIGNSMRLRAQKVNLAAAPVKKAKKAAPAKAANGNGELSGAQVKSMFWSSSGTSGGHSGGFSEWDHDHGGSQDEDFRDRCDGINTAMKVGKMVMENQEKKRVKRWSMPYNDEVYPEGGVGGYPDPEWNPDWNLDDVPPMEDPEECRAMINEINADFDIEMEDINVYIDLVMDPAKKKEEEEKNQKWNDKKAKKFFAENEDYVDELAEYLAHRLKKERDQRGHNSAPEVSMSSAVVGIASLMTFIFNN